MQIWTKPLGEIPTNEVKQAIRPTSFIRNERYEHLTILLAPVNWNIDQWKRHWNQKPSGIQALRTMTPSVNSDS